MVSRGKSLKRKQKFKEKLQGGPGKLPRAASEKEENAIPSKLRAIMEAKKLVTDGPTKRRGSSKQSSEDKGGTKTPDGATKAAEKKGAAPADTSDDKLKPKTIGPQAGRKPPSSAPAPSTSHKLGQKEFLREKKKRKQEQAATRSADDAALYRRDHVAFGDVAMAPPTIHGGPRLPKKAKTEGGAGAEASDKPAGARHWPARLQDALSSERLRQKVVDEYRERRKWADRPGGAKFPAQAALPE
eukprot:jgi/Mesvir1/25098/Mv21562-RA.1